MAYHIDTSQPIWRITFSGTLSNRDLQELLNDARNLEKDKSAVPNRLADLRQLEAIEVGFSEMSSLATARRSHTLPNAIKTALLTKGPVQFGIARMFQMLLEHPKIQVQVFSEEADALRWLAD